jgi:hypothetical protein
MSGGNVPGPKGQNVETVQQERGLTSRTSSTARGPAGLTPPKNAQNSATRTISGILAIQRLLPKIRQAAKEFNVPAKLIAVIVMHESQAVERVTWGFRFLENLAERSQAAAQGDEASIGVGQMQVKVAKQLRKKYNRLSSDSSVVDDLLDEGQAIRYVAAQLRNIRDQLETFLEAHKTQLTEEEILDLLAVGYNLGWESLQKRNLQDSKLGGTVVGRVKTIRQYSRYLRKTTANFQLISGLIQ